MEFSLYDISLILGIFGFLMLMFVFLSGLRIVKPPAKYRLHRRIGITGFVLSTLHGLMMLYFRFFS